MIALAFVLPLLAVALYLSAARLDRRAYDAWLSSPRTAEVGGTLLAATLLRALSVLAAIGEVFVLCSLVWGAS